MNIIFRSEKITIAMVTKSVKSLKKNLNMFLYNRNIIFSFWESFGYLQKFSENVLKRLSGLRTTYGESSEIFGKSSKSRR